MKYFYRFLLLIPFVFSSLCHANVLKNNLTDNSSYLSGHPETVSIKTIRGGLSGNYTVNSTIPTGEMNFNNFSDLAENLNTVGISGAVTVEIVAGTGPYSEQVIINEISGNSASNQLIINGNGETLQYLSANSNERATLKMNGTDYVTINNMVFKSLGAGNDEYGFTVHLMNGANYNTFNYCEFITDVNSITQNYAAFVTSNSHTAANASGLAVNHLTVDHCTAIGGYYCLIVNGPTTLPWAVNNTVTNNIVKDFYQYGIYLRGQNNSTVENNEICRPERTSVSTTYMLFLSNDMSGTSVMNNHIHTLAAPGVSATSTSNGIYGTSISSASDNQLLVANNLVYGFTGMNGGQYGIYLATLATAPSFVKIYHNTIALDNVTHTGASLARGIYHAGATNAGGLIDIKNNIIYVTTNSTGNKHCLYFLNANANIITNNNVLYNEATAGTNFTGFWNSTGYVTLSDWKTLGFDLNSKDDNPLFINLNDGNLKPQSPAIDNIGANVLNYVPFDYFGLPRSETPDPGTIEFLPETCFPPINLMATNVTLTSAMLNWVPSGNETSWNVEYGIGGFTQGTGTVISGISAAEAQILNLFPGTTYGFYVQSVCDQNSVSTWAGPATFTTLCQPIELPITEGFEGSHFPPLCWSRAFISGGGSGLWNKVSIGTFPVTAPHTGQAMASYGSFGFPAGTVGILASPAFIMNENAVAVKFWMYRDDGNLLLNDFVNVYFNTAPNLDGASLLGTINRHVELPPSVPANGWYEFGFQAPQGTLNQVGYFIFEGVGGTGNNMYIDDVEIIEVEPGAISGFVTSAVGGLLEGARVYSGSYEGLSNEQGYYQIQNIVPGTYTFFCEINGYFTSVAENISILTNQITTLNFELDFAQIVINPSSIQENLPPDGASVKTITLSNPAGTAPLSWSASVVYTSGNQKEMNSNETPGLPLNWTSEQVASFHDVLQPEYFNSSSSPDYNLNHQTNTAGKELSSKNLLWSNGSFITHPGAGYGGSDVSALQSDLGMTSYGPNANHNASAGNYFYIADDFQVTGKWTINTMTFFGYQTLSTTTSTITGVYLRIWDGIPDQPGNSVVWGDLTTNRLMTSFWSGVYRTPISDLSSILRPVMQIEADLAGCELNEGTYWVQYGFTGSLTSGPWGVPLTTLGQTTTGNALHKTNTGWQPLLDAGTLTQQGMPFLVNGEITNWLTLSSLSGQINPTENQTVDLSFDAAGLSDGVYHALINFQHNGQIPGDGTIGIPVELTVTPPSLPGTPTEPQPNANATLAPLQPIFLWTNGNFTTQVKIKIERIQFPVGINIYESQYFAGDSFDLSSVGITLQPKVNYRWRITAKNSLGETIGPWWSFQTIGKGNITGVVTDAFSGNPMQDANISIVGTTFQTFSAPDGTYSFSNILEGVYEISAMYDGYVTQSQNVQVNHGLTSSVNFAMSLFLPPPLAFTAQVQNFTNVQLSWNEPGSIEELIYDNNVATAFYVSPGFTMSTRMSPSQSCKLIKMKFFTSTQTGGFPFNATLFSWNGNQPGTQILYQQTVNAAELNWLEVDVSSQNLSFSGDFVVGFGSINPLAALGFDANLNSERSWDFNNSTQQWNTWPQAYLIRAVVLYDDGTLAELCPGQGKVSVVSNEIQSHPSDITEIEFLPISKKNSPDNRELIGYNLYRNDLVLTFTTETSYFDAALPGGTYTYNLTVVYTEGESAPAGPITVGIEYMGTIQGVVADQQSRAGVQGVIITVDELKGYSTTTNEQGFYSLNVPVGVYSVTVSKEGYYTQTITPVSVALAQLVTVDFQLEFTSPELLSVTPDFFGVTLNWQGNQAIPPYSDQRYSSFSTAESTPGYLENEDVQLDFSGNDYSLITCVVNCPPNAIIEAEECSLSTNGGCNATPNSFQTLNIGDVVCGNSWANGTQRDTDWYELVVDSPKTLSWTVTAEFPVLLFLLDGNNGCGQYTTLSSVSGEPCQTITASASVPPGVYWLWVGPITWELQLACGTSNKYVASITAEDAFISYFNVYRDDLQIAQIYNTSYFDNTIVQGETYCYAIDQVIEPGLVTGISNTICAMVPVQPNMSINPNEIVEFIQAGQISQKNLSIANNSSGTLDFSISVRFIYNSDHERSVTNLSVPAPNSIFSKHLPKAASLTDIETESGKSGESVLWDNGPLITNICTATGNNESMPQPPHTSTGINNNQAMNYAAADDFTIPEGEIWNIDSFEFFGYQTEAGDISTLNGIFITLWDDDPMQGGSIIWGDQVTNLFSSTYFTGIYRVPTSQTCLTNRAIHKIIASTQGLVLTSGTYWVEFSMTGTTSSGPWIPYVDEVGVIPVGNGIVRIVSNWSVMTIGGAGVEMPFLINGSVQGPWLWVDPAAGSVNGVGQENINIHFDGSQLMDGIYYASLLINSNDPLSPVVNVPVTLHVGVPMQEIYFDQGWNGWSAFINPLEENSFSEVVASVQSSMILSQYFTQLFYPAYGINTMGDFSNNHGYLSKMSQESLLVLNGTIADPVVNLNSGWNLFPVLTTCNLAANDVFGQMPGLIIAYEVAGNGIYYPEWSVFTLQEISPGKAYWVKMATEASYTFPTCGKKDKIENTIPLRIPNTTPWNHVAYTGTSHIVIFDQNASKQFRKDDLIGAFTDSGICAGLTSFDGNLVSMSVFGDDFSTSYQDGFYPDETIRFKLFRPSNMEVYDLHATYSPAFTDQGFFASNGLSVVTELLTSITGGLITIDDMIYLAPNPTDGVFTIYIEDFPYEIQYTIFDATGNIIKDGTINGSTTVDMSAHSKGVYFIRVTDLDQIWFKKLVIK